MLYLEFVSLVQIYTGMSSNIKVTLRKKANKQGLFPLVVRITKNRKTNYLYTGHYINRGQ